MVTDQWWTEERQNLEQTFSASVWREGNLYVAQCLEIDVARQGESEEAALENLREALELHLEPPRPTEASLVSATF